MKRFFASRAETVTQSARRPTGVRTAQLYRGLLFLILGAFSAGCHGGGGTSGPIASTTPPTVRPDLNRAVEFKNQGLVEIENGSTQLPAAIADFQKVTEYAPDDPLGYLNKVLASQRDSNRGVIAPTAELEKDVQRGEVLGQKSAPALLLAAELNYTWSKSTPARLKDAQRDVDAAIQVDPGYAPAQWEWFRERAPAEVFGGTLPSGWMPHLQALAKALPGNLVVVVRLAEASLAAGKPAQALPYLKEWKNEAWLQGSMGVSEDAFTSAIDRTISLAQSGSAAESLLSMQTATNLTKPGPIYKSAMAELVSPQELIFPATEGKPLSRLLHEPASDSPIGPPITVKFENVTTAAGLDSAGAGSGVASIAVGSLALKPLATGKELLYAMGKFPAPELVAARRDGRVQAWQMSGNRFQVEPLSIPRVEPGSTLHLADFEWPGKNPQFDPGEQHPLDIVALSPQGSHFLYRAPDGSFQDRTAAEALAGVKAATGAIFDINHDGLVDLIAGGAGPGLVAFAGKNNPADTRAEASPAADSSKPAATGRDTPGLKGGTEHMIASPFPGVATGFAFADFDGDGATDLYVSNAKGPGVYYHNLRQGLLEDQTTVAGLASAPPSGCAAAADWDNDGYPDLAVGALDGSGVKLYHNRGNGAFAESTPSSLAARTRGLKITSIRFLDYDNDGLEDIAVGVAGLPGHPPPVSGILLFHNAGHSQFVDSTSILPAGLAPVSQLESADLGDGGMSIVAVSTAGKLILLRNVGGSKNHWLNLALWGHHYDKGVVSAEGIGSEVQLRVGAHVQQKTVVGQLTHFGIGNAAHPDGIRALLTDGIPQDFPSSALPSLEGVSDTSLTELVVLQGSCPFVYGWDGRSFRFISDALCAAPLGLLLNSSIYAPADPVDYLVAPSWIRPRNGLLTFAVTEELAELTFLDAAELLAVDHPAGTTLVSNESFGGMKSTRPWYILRNPRPPVGAWDTAGHDVLSRVLNEDHTYVHDFSRGLYPGIGSDHWLTLDLGAFPQSSPVTLFLNGWIRWTNTTVNVAISRDRRVTPQVPRVEVPDGHGRWRTVIPFIGLVAGKSKTMAVDLSGKFLCADHRVRIHTNYEIYWDQAYFTLGRDESSEVGVTVEVPCKAELEYHGFSRMKQIAPYGPTEPDYREHLASRAWPPLPGFCTRYGEVTSLVSRSDDRWVTINSGDQCTLQFRAAPPPRHGMVRDYLIKLDGWDKDNNYYTAFSGSVGPYPFHAMKGYPYPASQHYPDDSAHQGFLHSTLTRYVSREQFLADLADRPVTGG